MRENVFSTYGRTTMRTNSSTLYFKMGNSVPVQWKPCSGHVSWTSIISSHWRCSEHLKVWQGVQLYKQWDLQRTYYSGECSSSQDQEVGFISWKVILPFCQILLVARVNDQRSSCAS